MSCSAQTCPWVVAGVVFVALGYVLAVVVVMRMLGEGGAPSTTLAWLLVVLSAPWIGVTLYYLLPRRLELRRLVRQRAQQADVSDRLDQLCAGPMEPAPPQGDHPVFATLAGGDTTSVAQGNRVDVLATGQEFFAGAAAEIERAQRFVHLEVYIFRPDAAGMKVLELLAQAAARGVEVRLLFDSFGSWSLNDRHLRALRDAGGQAVPFLPLLWRRRPFTLNLRNHRKLLVVDGHTAWLGRSQRRR